MSGILDFAASGVQAQGQIQASEAQARASEFNAQVGQEKAGIQVTQTAADVARSQREGRARAGASRAAAGVLGGLHGSSLDILESNAVQEELDILTIKQKGSIAEKDLLTGARLDILEAANTRVAGKIGAASTVLRGATSLARSGEQAAQLAVMASDINLKENIIYHSTVRGHKLYNFNYKGDDAIYRGVMAQDVLEYLPEAVTVMTNGYYGVDYNKLDLQMELV